MSWLPLLTALVAGFILGFAAAYGFRILHLKTAGELAEELFNESEARRKADQETVIENVKANFGNLSLEALSKSTEEFLKLANTQLESERKVAAQELETKKGAGSEKNLVAIKAPMVGTFYRAPSPDSKPYIEIGQTVDVGEVVCIIEAMKLMNEIKSEVKGKVVEVLVENANPVEYGQILFMVNTD